MSAALSPSRHTVSRHASRRGEWRMEFLAPSSRLAPFVRLFDAYAESGTGRLRRREMPSGLATLVFNLGAELRVEYPLETHRRYGAGTGFYTGLGSTHAITETDGSQTGAQVMLTALGARCLLGIPLAEVGDNLIDPSELLGPSAGRIIDRLGETDSPVSRLIVLEQEITRLIERPGNEPPGDIAWALRQIECRGGGVSMTSLAAKLGTSRKHLTVRFTREFGMGPKLLSRVIRFDRSARLARSRPDLGLAAVAAACGYADQAHLTRDWRQFSGSPPRELLRRGLPDGGGWAD